jgi:2-iminobutanoate/2-iminopropanoate deaminase
MKKLLITLTVAFITITNVPAQSIKAKKMEKREINPWEWQNQRSYAQAVEVKNAEATLYISGQTAIDENGISSNAPMESQLKQTIKNLEKVIAKAGYENKNIVRLNIYTTSLTEFFANFGILQNWINEQGIKQSSTVVEVNALFETLKIELEATVVR